MRYNSLIGLAAASLGITIANAHTEPYRERPAPRRYSPSGSIATGNRHTGLPHEHKREIARRSRRGW